MIALSPALFVATATGMVATDDYAASIAPLEDLDPILRDRHQASSPARTAAFINHVGYWSHSIHPGTSLWPLPLHAGCNRLASFAREAGVLHDGEAERGDIYLRWSVVEKRFTRAAIVVWSVEEESIDAPCRWWDTMTIEGHAGMKTFGKKGPAIKSGLIWARRHRTRYCPEFGDRIIAWADLDRRGKTEQVEPRRAA